MSVRTARLSDMLSLRAVAHEQGAQIVGPAAGLECATPLPLALMSIWQGVSHRYQTVVLHGDPRGRGFAQAMARPGRESWDIVRLKCQAPDEGALAAACIALLERICAETAQWGALRTFTRVPAESEALMYLSQLSFRAYATESTLLGRLASLVLHAPPPALDMRVRLPQDAWDIFSLYCAVTPALVRHAEGRSLREWLQTSIRRGPLGRRSPRELVVGEQGALLGWLRLVPRGHAPHLLEVLVRPEAAVRLPEMLRFASEYFGLAPDAPVVCRTREYDGAISATLEAAGFADTLRETLLVRHTVARVTERQLLIAALRAQGLGIDISQYRRTLEPAHQRLASSREAEQYQYDRYGRICLDR